MTRHWKNYLRLKPFYFDRIKDVRDASCIDEDDLSYWISASNISEAEFRKGENKHKNKDWSDIKRINAFTNAVQKRRVRLYEKLYDVIGWGEWNDKLEKDFRKIEVEIGEQIIDEKNDEALPEIIEEEQTPAILQEVPSSVSIVDDIRLSIERLLPEENVRSMCLEMFCESIIHANIRGNDKWGITIYQDSINLNIGGIVVFSIIVGGVWFLMDKMLSEKYNGYKETPHAYDVISSVAVTYTPSERNFSEAWAKISKRHYRFIENAKAKYTALNVRSQRVHSNEVIDYLEEVTGKSLPRPKYE